MNLKLIDFIKEHENWEELLKEPPFCIKIKRKNNFIIFNYNQISSDFNNDIVRECRGIILYEPTWECVCHAFDKFGNYGEDYVPNLDQKSIYIREKVDGSLIKIWFFEDRWHYSSNGMIDLKDVETIDSYVNFMDLFKMALYSNNLTIEEFEQKLNPKYTYMFELVSPLNRVVIEYKKPDIYLLAARERKMDKLFLNFEIEGIKSPKKYYFKTISEIIEATQTLSWNEEGYVVSDKYNNMMKIKSPEYIKSHYFRNNNVITNKRLISIILAGEIKEFSLYCPDYINKIKILYDCIEYIKNQANQALIEIKNSTKGFSKKDYYFYVKEYISSSKCAALKKIIKFFLYNYEYEYKWEEFSKTLSLNKWEDIINEKVFKNIKG